VRARAHHLPIAYHLARARARAGARAEDLKSVGLGAPRGLSGQGAWSSQLAWRPAAAA